MNNGFYLSLMIGPLEPLPASCEVIEALTSVQVTTTTEGPSVFQLSFTLSTKSPLHTLFLLSGGSLPPIMRVIIVVTVNGSSEVLMDGVMTNHEVTPGSDLGHATLTISGEDLTRLMDYIDLTGFPFPAMPDYARVTAILAKYAFLGIVPLVIPSVLMDIPIPTERIPMQKGKDLEYIQQLADESGYVFYIDPGPVPGMSTAYWGPEIKVGLPQPALNINMDAYTNVESLNFSFNSEKKTMPVIFVQNKTTKIPIPIPVPDITPLSPPLGLIAPSPKKFEIIIDAGRLSMIRAAAIGLAKAAKTSDAVSASGNLNVLRYGHVLKARKLVGVRGAGPAFDGLYYVKSVIHNIKRGEYKQSFTLTRNGLVSTFSEVPV
jgi:hypothetical protein